MLLAYYLHIPPNVSIQVFQRPIGQVCVMPLVPSLSDEPDSAWFPCLIRVSLVVLS